MPSPFRLLGPVALAALLLPLAACGEKKQEQSSTIQIKDMEIVDGTASDAMTDLDGVRSDAAAIVDTGNASAASNAAAPATATKEKADAAESSSAEVVAEQ